MSALCYYFGVQAATAHPELPIGMIGASWGGTAIQVSGPTLAALDAARTEPSHAPLCLPLQVWMSPAALQKCPATAAAPPASEREALARDALQAVLRLHGCPTRPSSLFFSEIAPLQGRAVKGVLWYQGEANAGDPYNYGHCLLPAMIEDWRASWAAAGAAAELPFLFVQVRRSQCADPGVPLHSQLSPFSHA